MLKTRKNWNNFVGVTVMLLVAGCSTTIQTTTIKSPFVNEIYRSGIPSSVSTGRFIVMASPDSNTRKDNEPPTFVISIANTSDKAIDFDTTNVSVFLDGKRLKVFTFEEIKAATERKQAIATFMVALGGAMQSAAAQQQASYQTNAGRYNTYGTNTYSSGTYSGWSYNPAAGQAAANAVNAQTAANIDSLRANSEASLAVAAKVMLRRETVSPGAAHGGKVVLENFDISETGNTLLLKVDVDGDVHEFSFAQSRLKK